MKDRYIFKYLVGEIDHVDGHIDAHDVPCETDDCYLAKAAPEELRRLLGAFVRLQLEA